VSPSVPSGGCGVTGRYRRLPSKNIWRSQNLERLVKTFEKTTVFGNGNRGTTWNRTPRNGEQRRSKTCTEWGGAGGGVGASTPCERNVRMMGSKNNWHSFHRMERFLLKCLAMVLSLGSLFLFCLLCLNAVAILNTRRFLAPCKVPRNFLYQPCVRTFMLFSSPPHLISQMDLWLASLPSMSSLSVQLQHKFAVTRLS
jgi:hypothetical protein